jgi:hypothetical protein
MNKTPSVSRAGLITLQSLGAELNTEHIALDVQY